MRAPVADLRVNRLVELHWRDWGGDSVALEAGTGRLYQIDPFSAAVMACLEGGARQESAVMQALAVDLGVDADEQLAAAVKSVVERFVQLGWLERDAG